MNKEQNLEELITRIVAPTVEDSIIQLTLINKVLFELTTHIYPLTKGDVYKSRANIICQMIIAKNAHIITSAKGISINDKLIPVIDPTAIGVIVRNVFETVVMFHNVFTYHKDPAIKSLVYDLWDIAGLAYRQKFTTVLSSEEIFNNIERRKMFEENKIKHVEELNFIKTTISRIKQSNLFKSNLSNQKVINHLISTKDFKLNFHNGKIIPISWQNAANLMKYKQNQMQIVYTLLSLYAHPSSVSVFQYDEMFKDGDNIGLTRLQFFILSSLNISFIVEYLKLFPEGFSIFNNLPEDEKIIINSLIRLIRGDEYCID